MYKKENVGHGQNGRRSKRQVKFHPPKEMNITHIPAIFNKLQYAFQINKINYSIIYKETTLIIRNSGWWIKKVMK